MKVLVTGGTGFIGSHITDLLVEEGHEVVVVDNLSQSDLTYLNREARFYQADITTPGLFTVLDKEKPEVIIHQAAQVNVHSSVKDPLRDGKTNIIGTLQLLQGAVQTGVKKVIYASTCAVYGDPQTLPIGENHPVNPLSGYALSKWAGEAYVRLFYRLHGIKYTILRYANVYGPRQGKGGEGGVVSIFAKQMKKGIAPVIYGDGGQTRDFVYVKDVARANLLALAGGDQETINIGSGHALSINQLFTMMAKLTGCNLSPQKAPSRLGDIRHSCLDRKKAELLLGWAPRYSLEKGLQQTLASIY